MAPLYHTYEDETAVPSADVTIHPIMRRKKWNFPLPEHLADFPLGGDLDGDWNAVSIGFLLVELVVLMVMSVYE